VPLLRPHDENVEGDDATNLTGQEQLRASSSPVGNACREIVERRRAIPRCRLLPCHGPRNAADRIGRGAS
jgi:hypothetical protein